MNLIEEKFKELLIKYIDDLKDCSKSATRCMSYSYGEYSVDNFLKYVHNFYKVHETICESLDNLPDDLGELISHSFPHIYKVFCEIIRKRLVTKSLAEKYNIAIVYLSITKSYRNFVEYYSDVIGGMLLETLHDLSKEEKRDNSNNKTYFDNFIEEMVKLMPKNDTINTILEAIEK